MTSINQPSEPFHHHRVPHFNSSNWSEKSADILTKPTTFRSLWEKFKWLIGKMSGIKEDDKVNKLTTAAIAQIESERKASGLAYSQMAFITIDPQVDFVDGAFNVPINPSQVEGKVLALKVASNISRYLRARGAYAFATKDHHPLDHSSFHNQHGVAPFTVVNLKKNSENNFAEQDQQMVWPVHCVFHGDKRSTFVESQETIGANCHSSFDSSHLNAVFTKGMDKNVESYSAIFTVYGKEASPVVKALSAKNIAKVYLGGLCTDYCVGHSAGHLALLGFDVSVVANGVAGISPQALSNLQETSKLLASGKWRRDINDPKTVYELGTPNGAYQPCEAIQQAVSEIKEGQRQPTIHILA